VKLTVLSRDGPGVAVASGAVLRALNKRGGPERILRSSYGIFCREIYDEDLPGHKETAKLELDIDGEEYVKDSMVWLIKKVGISLFKKSVTPFRTSLTLCEQGNTVSGEPERRQFRLPMHKIISLKVGESFVCTQTLYVSDISTESHYQKYHPKNRGEHTLRGIFNCSMLTTRRKTRDRG
jgi:hypothetical protein